MRYLSVCSGIEAATCAWHPLGWTPVGFSEIEKFPSAVLAHHYPDVPNFGDMSKFQEWPNDLAPNLLVGGTPCQSFSVAGLRKGLADPRGNLAIVFLGLLDRLRPRWMVWENVPGVLSVDGGRAFGAFLGGLGELGYGWSYRVLDAQYFGVAQRRRRVFVVGHAGGWARAAAVLLESSSLRGDPAPSRCVGEIPSRTIPLGVRTSVGFHPNARACEMTFSLERSGPVTRGQIPGVGVVAADGTVEEMRYLTPLEVERLQGFPDDYTLVPYRGKPAADGPRYMALGNSMAVPVMRWIGERIARVEEVK